jgi:hypothetical protein
VFIHLFVCGRLQAIRAFRHPERYGPRRGGIDGDSQSRARGLGRAILDTFPIVKFASNQNTGSMDQPRDKDMEWGFSTEMSDHTREPKSIPPAQSRDDSARVGADLPPAEGNPQQANASEFATTSQPLKRPPKVRQSQDGRAPDDANGDDVMPEAIGRETCPICIVDFEEGDDLRQLPCEGHHRFHQECVDPWLLELSSSCPICRQGTFRLNCLNG